MKYLYNRNIELKRFIIRSLIFASIVIAIFGAMECLLRSRVSSYSMKAEYIRNHGKDISTLILGSSHTYYGLNPEWIGDSCFNLANISQTPEYDYELLKENISTLPNLHRVILPISYFTFTDKRLEDSEEWYLCINYKINMNMGLHSDLSKYNFTISHFPSFTARLKNLLKLDTKTNRCDSLGFGLGYTLDNRDALWESGAKKRVEHLTCKDSPRRIEVRKLLDSMLEFCKDNEIEVLMVITPVWHTFRENADSLQLALMRHEATRLSERHNFPLLDLYDSSLFTEEDFFDSDHLSVNGARRLSSIVSKF